MSNKLIFDDGIESYEINGNGVLRFNPSDPNVYDRFCGVVGELKEIEAEYEGSLQALADKETPETDDQGFALGGELLAIMRAMDQRIKGRLSYVFGAENDFDALLGGVNLLALGKNGQRIVTNVLAALTPIVETGLNRQMQDEAVAAVQQAKQNREQRRAKK